MDKLKWIKDDDIKESNIFISNWIRNNSKCELIKAYQVIKSNRKHTQVDCRCECGNIFSKRYNDFKRQSNRVCNKCLGRDFYTYKDVKNFIEKDIKHFSLKLLSESYDGYDKKLIVEDEIGYKYSPSLHTLKALNSRNTKMEIVTVNNSFSIENIRLYLSINTDDYTLLSDKWFGNHDNIAICCNKGHEYNVSWSALNMGQRCPFCHLDNVPKGKDSPVWKGGYTIVNSYLRNNLNEWKSKCIKNCNYKCILTGLRFHAVHHITGFNTIFAKSLVDTGVKYDKLINGYSEEDLKTLKNDVIKKHEHLGGVTLSEEIHKLFHSEFGLGNNNSDQINKFIKKYFNGEYDCKLSDTHKSINSITNYEEAKKLASFCYAEK